MTFKERRIPPVQAKWYHSDEMRIESILHIKIYITSLVRIKLEPRHTNWKCGGDQFAQSLSVASCSRHFRVEAARRRENLCTVRIVCDHKGVPFTFMVSWLRSLPSRRPFLFGVALTTFKTGLVDVAVQK